jgi:hypothetical protein
MKPRHAQKWFGALLLVGVLTASFESHALPPRQHAARGVIESIDHAKRIVVLIQPKTEQNRVFVWNETTRFRRGWHKASPDMLRPGDEVKLWYRREVGRFVVREVGLSNIAPSSGVQNVSSQVTKDRTSP